jgi:hypothetical protein
VERDHRFDTGKEKAPQDETRDPHQELLRTHVRIRNDEIHDARIEVDPFDDIESPQFNDHRSL